MKFHYEYRTSDNAKHSGVVAAPTRDAAYDALKSQGIKPSRVTEAPGFFNKLFGKGKRWMAIGTLGLLCLALVVVLVRNRNQAPSARAQEPSAEFIVLSREADEVLSLATNDVSAARAALKDVFRRHYPNLSTNRHDSEAAQTLYGRLTFYLDQFDAGEKISNLPH